MAIKKVPDRQPTEITPLDAPEIEQTTPHPDESDAGDIAAKAPVYKRER